MIWQRAIRVMCQYSGYVITSANLHMYIVVKQSESLLYTSKIYGYMQIYIGRIADTSQSSGHCRIVKSLYTSIKIRVIYVEKKFIKQIKAHM